MSEDNTNIDMPSEFSSILSDLFAKIYLKDLQIESLEKQVIKQNETIETLRNCILREIK